MHQPIVESDLDHSGSDVHLHQPGPDNVTAQPGYGVLHTATPLGDNIQYGGNEVPSLEVPVLVFQNIPKTQTEESSLRRSNRSSKLPAKLNDFVLDNKLGKVPYDQRSVSGYFVFVNGCLVSWKSKKQATLSKSSVEAEYSAMVSATCEVIWILKVLKDLNLDNLVTVTLFCDNKSAIHIAVNPVMHEKTKHFDIDVHLVREIVASSSIKAEKVDYKGLIADILTKALGSAQHTMLTKRLGMVNMFVS
ncbi:hypothetical protein Tco_0673552 [Tanacetum coccineum]